MRVVRNLIYLAGAAALVLYIANPGSGVFELIPDNLPLVGNLDEAAAVGLLIALVKRWRNRPELREATAQPQAGRGRQAGRVDTTAIEGD